MEKQGCIGKESVLKNCKQEKCIKADHCVKTYTSEDGLLKEFQLV